MKYKNKMGKCMRFLMLLALVCGLLGGAGKTVRAADFKGAKAVQKVQSSIKLNKTSAAVNVGSSITLKATVTGGGKVTWSSSKPNVASVKNGTVTGKKVGTAVITAKVNGKKAQCTVTVKKKISITLNKTAVSLKAGKTVRLTATVTGMTKSVVWSSSNKNIATVGSKGLVTGKKAGSAVITAKVGGVTATCRVTVKKAAAATLAKVGRYYYEYNSVSSWPGYMNASDLLAVLDISNNNIEFMIYHAGINGSPLYMTNLIKVPLKNNKASFTWSDSWGNSGNGTVTFSKNQVSITMKTTSYSRFNRWGWWQEPHTIKFERTITEEEKEAYRRDAYA